MAQNFGMKSKLPAPYEFLPSYELPFWINQKTAVSGTQDAKKQAFVAAIIMGIIAIMMLLITKIHKRP